MVDTSTQRYIYDGKIKTFAIRTTPSKVSGFNISYSELPIYAGIHSSKEYLVTINRPSDSRYKAVNTVAKLIIDAAEPDNINIPTAKNGILTNQTDTGVYSWTEGNATASDIAAENIQEVVFTPVNTNYKKVKFSIWNGFAPGTRKGQSYHQKLQNKKNSKYDIIFCSNKLYKRKCHSMERNATTFRRTNYLYRSAPLFQCNSR